MTSRRSPPKGAPDRSSPALPDLYVLDRFTERDLETWERASRDLDDLHAKLYFNTELERRRLRAELIDAINVKPAAPFDFSGWCRMMEYRWGNTPLSSAGSIRGFGGRFNVGNDIELSLIDPFPALYVADSQATAYRERYQISDAGAPGGGLSNVELDLGVSTCTVRLDGHIDRVLDVTDPLALAPICRIFKKIRMPPEVARIMKRLKMKPDAIKMVNTPRDLQRAIIERNWRTWPIQFGIPSPSQMLAEIAIAAGYEAIRYRSSKSCTGKCLAIFSGNLATRESFVALTDAAPDTVNHSRLDIESADELAGWEHAPRSKMRK